MPILGAPAQDLVELTQKLPDLLKDIPKLPNEEIDWRKVSCDYGSLTSDRNDPFDLWNDAKATEAFADVYKYYKKNEKTEKEYGFTSTIFNYFHGKPLVNCADILSDGCNDPTECGQGDWPNARVNSPAGYMIINSIISLHMHYKSQYNGLSAALNHIQGLLGSFTSIFAPQIDPMKADKIMIDILMMGFGAFSAGAFNSWLKNMPYFKKNADGGGGNRNNLGELKDTTNSWMNQGMNIIKDSKSALSELKVQNDVSTFLTAAVKNWMVTTNETLGYYMRDAPLDLLNVIVNGKMWDPKAPTNALDVTAQATKTLFGFIIPYAWSLSNTEFSPFIATTEGVEGKKGDCKSFDPLKKFKSSFTDSSHKYFESNRFCDQNGEVVWLLNMKPKTGTCTWGGRGPGATYCKPIELGQIHGWESLNDTKTWGVSRAELVSAAMRTWKGKGKKNGGESPDPTSPDMRNQFLEHGIGAIGMVNIPVCSLQEAIETSWKKTDNWPCA